MPGQQPIVPPDKPEGDCVSVDYLFMDSTPVSVSTRSEARPARAWLALAVGDDRQHGGNDGYDDQAETHYSWDDTVPNHSRLQVGDAIVVWDKQCLVGASVIEEIQTQVRHKVTYKCPNCGKASLKMRKTAAAKHLLLYKCFKCGGVFDEPVAETRTTVASRSRHDAGWVDLYGVLDGATLRGLCVSPRSQLSMRALDWPAFVAAVAGVTGPSMLQPLRRRLAPVHGGHEVRTVRVRAGQGTFRQRVLERYGDVCALTGPAPRSALEAAHLYQYAEVGQHYDDGGLPLRRDIHRLFDLGGLAVTPELRIDVAPSLRSYEVYRGLQGKPLSIEGLSTRQRHWLELHWAQHR